MTENDQETPSDNQSAEIASIIDRPGEGAHEQEQKCLDGADP